MYMWVQMVGGRTCSLGSSQLLTLPLVRVELVPHGRAVLLLKERRGSTGRGGGAGEEERTENGGCLGAHKHTHAYMHAHTPAILFKGLKLLQDQFMLGL